MMKNDYRRSLILLRPNAPGYSGHVRLERRTLIGSMYMVLSVPPDGGSLCAALIRRDAQNTYFAIRLGELRRDSRGQATLAYSFDPRNIDGRTLEEYLLIAIVRTGAENCDIVLSGNVNGSQEVDWNSVRGAACSVCACVGSPAGDICPDRPMPTPPSGNRPAAPGEGPIILPTPTLPGGTPAAPGEGPVDPPTPTLPGDTSAAPGEGPVDSPTPTLPGDTPADPGEGPVDLPTLDLPENMSDMQGEGGGGSPESMPALPASRTVVPVGMKGKAMERNGNDSQKYEKEGSPCAREGSVSMRAQPEDYYEPEDIGFYGETVVETSVPAAPRAGDLLGIDMTSPWPGVSEQLRGLFIESPAVELMLGDGHVYIEASMPEGSGYENVFIGVRTQDGEPISVAYALPARYTPEPPPGLEDYIWKGGAAEGWWVLYADPATGDPVS